MAEVRDPVCGMTIDDGDAAATSTRDDVTYYFCSSSCKEAFDAEPEKYASAAR